jgi:alanyl aminopeptidase
MMLARLAVVLLGASLVLSCGGAQEATPRAAATPPPVSVAPAPEPIPTPAPPTLRLPNLARPTRYAADLTLVPTEDSFRGAIEIAVEVAAPTQVLWLNGRDLEVVEASLTQGGAAVPAHAQAAGEDFLGFTFDKPLGAGAATLRILYRGKLATNDTDGVFKQKDGDDWYLYTQFEATDARRAFPCFDEPHYKVPWQLTLHVKKDHVGLSNTPLVSETEEPGGLKTLVFAETTPLPSYLLAFAVGPLEAVAVPSASKAPIRIVVPRGHAQETGWAVESTPPLLAALEAYFGTPYPYEKLDFVAIPRFSGAMENPGLITFHLPIILSDPKALTLAKQRRYASICAHELAHQWFGNLVTMAWWDDLWLNEAFATWMAAKVLVTWKPEWRTEVDQVRSRSEAMRADSLITARKIRQPIESNDDIANAFDDITYSKGGAVIAMFEAWVGEAVFQKGVQAYLAKHAFGNATAADFLAAVGEAAGRDVAGPFSTFLDQGGLPLVSVELSCQGPPKLVLRQERYLPIGSVGQAGQGWQLPLCAAYQTKKGPPGRACTLLTTTEAELPLPEASSCPAWVLPNAGALGYYRFVPKGDLLARLVAKSAGTLSLAERVGLITEATALVQSGHLQAGEALSLLVTLARDPQPRVLSATLGLVQEVGRTLVTGAERPAFAHLIQKLYGRRARALGWKRGAKDDEDTRLLRPVLVGLVATDGEDKALAAGGRQLAEAWLKDRTAVDPDLVEMSLRVAAHDGDKALFDRLHEAAKKTADREDQRRLLRALGTFGDPALVTAAQAILFTDDFTAREAMQIVWVQSGDERTRASAYAFVKANFDALVARLPRDYGAYLPSVGEDFCSETDRDDVEAFFAQRSTKLLGGARNLAQVLEQISLCNAYRQKQRPSVVAFLAKF